MLQIAILNNTAVGHLVQGFQVDKAEEALQQAMLLLNQAEYQPRQTHEHELQSTGTKQPAAIKRSIRELASSSSLTCVPSHDDVDTSIPVGDHSNMVEDQEGEDYQAPVESFELARFDPDTGCHHNVLPLYNRALFLTCTAEPEEVTATVLYNQGLVQHIQGLTHQRPASLRKALKLYESAVSILQRQSGGESLEDLAVDELLVLALFYNMGHAHAQMFSKVQVDCCFKFLYQILEDTDECYGSDEDQAFFFFNALVFQGAHLSSAPAA